MEKKNDGKPLERLVALIQDSLNDNPNVKIHSNYKLPTLKGRKREIDVLLEAKINGMTMNIAIECKEHSKPVSVEKIEAFDKKCERLRINKKVFVAINGYQADAKDAAEECNIDLFNLSEISKDIISKWFPISELRLICKLGHLNIVLDIDDEKVSNLDLPDELYLHFYDGQEPEEIKNYVCRIMDSERDKINNIMTLKFMKDNAPNTTQENMPFEIRLSGVYISIKDEKINVTDIKSSIEATLYTVEADITTSNSYHKIDGEIHANAVSLNLGNQKVDIILGSENKPTFYLTNEKGTINKLKHLGSYDSKTNKFTKLNN